MVCLVSRAVNEKRYFQLASNSFLSNVLSISTVDCKITSCPPLHESLYRNPKVIRVGLRYLNLSALKKVLADVHEEYMLMGPMDMVQRQNTNESRATRMTSKFSGTMDYESLDIIAEIIHEGLAQDEDAVQRRVEKDLRECLQGNNTVFRDRQKLIMWRKQVDQELKDIQAQLKFLENERANVMHPAHLSRAPSSENSSESSYRL